MAPSGSGLDLKPQQRGGVTAGALEPIPETSRELSSLASGSGVGEASAVQDAAAAAVAAAPSPTGRLAPRRRWQAQAADPAGPAAPVAAPQQQERVWELDPAMFVLGRKLGAGAYSTVYLAHTVDADAVAHAVTAAAIRGGSVAAAGSGTTMASAEEEAVAASASVGRLSGGGGGYARNSAAAASGGGAAGGSSRGATGLARKCVVKKLDRVPSRAGPGGIGPNQQDLMNEVLVLQAAGHHPNLVHFYGWYRDPHDGLLCLVMSYCEGGTLSRLLRGRPGERAADPEAHFPEEVVMGWFVQLLLALHHLHSRHIIHRDIKPDNILMSRNYKVTPLVMRLPAMIPDDDPRVRGVCLQIFSLCDPLSNTVQPLLGHPARGPGRGQAA